MDYITLNREYNLLKEKYNKLKNTCDMKDLTEIKQEQQRHDSKQKD